MRIPDIAAVVGVGWQMWGERERIENMPMEGKPGSGNKCEKSIGLRKHV